jgi:hypothetical protein
MNQAQFLDRTSPETQGIPSAAILAFLDAVDEQIHDLHSIMLLRHAAVVAVGWWTPHQRELRYLNNRSGTGIAVLRYGSGAQAIRQPGGPYAGSNPSY